MCYEAYGRIDIDEEWYKHYDVSFLLQLGLLGSVYLLANINTLTVSSLTIDIFKYNSFVKSLDTTSVSKRLLKLFIR